MDALTLVVVSICRLRANRPTILLSLSESDRQLNRHMRQTRLRKVAMRLTHDPPIEFVVVLGELIDLARQRQVTHEYLVHCVYEARIHVLVQAPLVIGVAVDCKAT